MDLPKLPWNWYWHITVSTGPNLHINIRLKRKVLGLFRTAIPDRGGNGYMILKSGQKFDMDRQQELIDIARKIFETRFDQSTAIRVLGVRFPEAKVTKW